MKNAYLIVSDLHRFYKNLRSRVDYQAEIDYVWNYLLSLIDKYSVDREVSVIFLGDLFHRGYPDSFSAVNDNNLFRELRSKCSGIYSVLGNHETSYYKDNPFYTLVNSIDSEKVSRIRNKVCEPVGVSNVINVIDELTDGEVTFYFNHYGTPVSTPRSDGVSIGLFHQDIVSQTVVTQAEKIFGTSVYAKVSDVEGNGILNGYKYSFFGHMHQMFGMYALDNGNILYYLGSLGRTNIAEVNDEYLVRDIPVVLVDDGVLTGIQKNIFNLPNREQCVNEEAVLNNKEDYENRKQVLEARSYSFNGDNPMEELLARLAGDAMAIQIASELTRSPIDSIGSQLFREVDSYGR